MFLRFQQVLEEVSNKAGVSIFEFYFWFSQFENHTLISYCKYVLRVHKNRTKIFYN